MAEPDIWQQAWDDLQAQPAAPAATATPAAAAPGVPDIWQQAWDDLQKPAAAPVIVPTQQELETLQAPEGSPQYLAAMEGRPLLASEIPAATARPLGVMDALMQGLPQPTPDYKGFIPRRPFDEAPVTVPEAYREPGGGIPGVINALGFAAEQPIITPEQMHGLLTVGELPGRFGADLLGQQAAERAAEQRTEEALSGFTTPAGLAQMALLKYPVARLAFGAEQLGEVPQNVSEAIRMYQAGNTPAAAAAATEATLNAAMGLPMVGEPIVGLGRPLVRPRGLAESPFGFADITVPGALAQTGIDYAYPKPEPFTGEAPKGFSLDPNFGRPYHFSDETRSSFEATGAEPTPGLRALAADFGVPVESLQPVNYRGGETSRDISGSSAARSIRDAEALIRANGGNPIWIRASDKVPFAGAHVHGTPDVFLNADALDLEPVRDLATHEFGHYLQTDAPDLWGGLAEHVAQTADIIRAKNYVQRLKILGYNPSPRVALKEAVSDIVKEALRDPLRFRRAVGDNLGLRVLDAARNWLTNIIERLRTGPEGPRAFEDLTTNLQATRQAVMDAITGAQKRRVAAAEMAPPKGEVPFSRVAREDQDEVRLPHGGPTILRPKGVPGPRGTMNYPTISTRYPTHKTKATEDARAQTLVNNLEQGILPDQNYATAVADFHRQVLPKEFLDRNYEKMLRNAVDHFTNNLWNQHLAFRDEPWFDEATRQYEGYNKHAHTLSEETGAHPVLIIDAQSAMSPQTPPDESFALAERMANMLYKGGAGERWDRHFTKVSDGFAAGIEPFDMPFVKGKTFWDIWNWDPQTDRRLKDWKPEQRDTYKGELLGLWARTFDGVHNTTDFFNIMPNGQRGDLVHSDITGLNDKIRWRSNGQSGRGIKLLLGVDPLDILQSPKVSNYTSNIRSPTIYLPNYTADTHAVNIAHGRGQGSPKVRPPGSPPLRPDEPGAIIKYHFGGNQSGITGERGGYGLHGEAAQRAAARAGMEVGPFQAGGWTGQQIYMSKDSLGDFFSNLIDTIQNEAHKGNLTAQRAWQESFDLAQSIHTGPTDPPWFRRYRGQAPGAEVTSYSRQLPEEDGRRGAGGPGPGVGRDVARGAPGGREPGRLEERPSAIERQSAELNALKMFSAGEPTRLQTTEELKADDRLLGADPDTQAILDQNKYWIAAEHDTVNDVFGSHKEAMAHAKTTSNAGEYIVQRETGRPDRVIFRQPHTIASRHAEEVAKYIPRGSKLTGEPLREALTRGRAAELRWQKGEVPAGAAPSPEAGVLPGQTALSRIAGPETEYSVAAEPTPGERPAREEIGTRAGPPQTGKPFEQTLFRGHSLGDPYASTVELPTFTDSARVAGKYARQITEEPGAAPRTGAYKVSMKNPLVLGALDEDVVSLGDLRKAFEGKVSPQRFEAWVKDWDDSEKFRYDGDWKRIEYMSRAKQDQAYTDTFRLGDDAHFVAMARQAGYDGLIARGTFVTDIGHPDELGGMGWGSYDPDTMSAMEYRPFSAAQIEPAKLPASYARVAEEPSQTDFERVAAEGDKEKMRGHIETVQRMTEVSPEVKERVESWYAPTTLEALHQQANATIDKIGLDEAAKVFERSRTAGAEAMALGHNVAVRLDQLGRYDEAAEVRDNMAKKLTTPAQALWFISTIGKTSPEGLIRTAQKLVSDLIEKSPAWAAKLQEFDRITRQLSSLPEGPVRDAATEAVLKQLAKVNKRSEIVNAEVLNKLVEQLKAGALKPEEIQQALTKYFKIPRVTPENTARILAAQKAWAEAKDPLIKMQRGAEMMDSVYSLVPQSMWDKIRATAVISMILHGRLPIRIGVSNVLRMFGQMTTDAILNVPRDIGNIFTGRKTITGEQLAAITSGLLEPARAVKAGYDEARLRGLTTIPSFKEGVKTLIELANLTTRGLYETSDIKRATHTFSSRFGRLFEDAVTLVHNTVPYGFWTAAFRSSLVRQMRIARVETPTAEMISTAQLDGNKAIFYNDTALYQALMAVRKILDLPTAAVTKGKYGLGTALVPFARVPAAVLTEGALYTPFGLGKAGIEILRPFVVAGAEFRPKEFGDAMVKAALGTGSLVLAGYQLAKIGVLTGAPDDNKDIEAMRRASGWGAFRINLSELKRRALSGNWWAKSNLPAEGDLITNYNWLEPIAFPIAMGADIAKSQDQREIDLKRGRITSNAILTATGAGVQSVLEHPMLQNLASSISTISEGQWSKAAADLFANVPGNFVPSLVRQTSQYMDNTVRESRGGTYVEQESARILQQIPGLSEKYPPKYDVFGQAMQRYNYGNNSLINVFFNPAMVSKFKSNPELAEMVRIYNATGSGEHLQKVVPAKLTINGKQVQLTNEQVAAYQRYVGQQGAATITRIMASPGYAREPLGMKQAIMGQILTAVNNAAKIDLFGQTPVSIGMGARGPSISKPTPMELVEMIDARRRGLKTIPGIPPGPPNAPVWPLEPRPSLPSLQP